METSPDTAPANDEPRPDYDFRAMRGVVRGKYAVADEAGVNVALREYLRDNPATTRA
jgi:hypothetical protein